MYQFFIPTHFFNLNGDALHLYRTRNTLQDDPKRRQPEALALDSAFAAQVDTDAYANIPRFFAMNFGPRIDYLARMQRD